MTLYAANVLDMAKPIETKRSKKKKADTPAPTPEETPVETKPPVSEKRMAALEKAKEARKRKREEVEAAKKAEQKAIEEKQAEIKAKQDEIAAKKEALKEKRRLAREAKRQEVSPPPTEETASSSVQPDTPVVVKEKKRRITKEKDPNQPPEWFKKYVEGVKKEEAKVSTEKRPAKIVQEEAREFATNHWNDGLTRDRVQNEVDGHMSRMYGMIFNRR
jgi:multidrug efflux pump subunit AcrA (membrane-fusion protein)